MCVVVVVEVVSFAGFDPGHFHPIHIILIVLIFTRIFGHKVGGSFICLHIDLLFNFAESDDRLLQGFTLLIFLGK